MRAPYSNEPPYDFRDTCSKLMATVLIKFSKKIAHGKLAILKASWLRTPLGPMIAMSDDEGLYLLEFAVKDDRKHAIKELKIKDKVMVIPSLSEPIRSIETELTSYFGGTLTEFKTPLCLLGSPFQNLVWNELACIPYGVTRSYLEQAERIKKPTAYRAVANANGSNPMAIVIPCHRIINNNGNLGGYGGEVWRKQWLINHEKQRIQS